MSAQASTTRASMRCFHCAAPIFATGNEHAPFAHMTGSAFCSAQEMLDQLCHPDHRRKLTQARPNLSLLTRQTFYELTPAHDRSLHDRSLHEQSLHEHRMTSG